MRLALVLGSVGALLVLPLVLLGAVAGAAGGTLHAAGANSNGAAAPSSHAQADIPADYLAWYTRWAAECPGLNWAVVAAIGKLESDHGRSRLPGVTSGMNSHGAAGPMQIGIGGQAGNTWASYHADGDLPPDGVASVYHPPDAIRAAVGYLCAHGASNGPEGVRSAVFAYNHSTAYVEAVLRLAEGYAATSPSPAAGADARALLTNPQVQLTDNARADLEAGVIDQRVITLLAALAERYPPITVSVLKTGHSRYVDGTRTVSLHTLGRAADVSELAGQPVSAANPAARAATAWLASLSGPMRPAEVGSPFPRFEAEPGHFHDAAHTDHLHVGTD